MTNPDIEGPDHVTYREVRELLRTFAASDWISLTLRVDGMSITAGRHGPPSGAAPPAAASVAASPAATAPAVAPRPRPTPNPSTPVPSPADAQVAPPTEGSTDLSGCVPVRSPAVGAFWAAPQPGAPPFAEVGHSVAEGDQLAIVEVMKLMNPVLAPRAGEIAGICASDAELVEYDQVLFWIRPLGPGDPAGG